MMDHKLRRIVDEDRRLVFLKLLGTQGDYSLPHFALRDALAQLGHSEPLDKIKVDAAWLEEQDLVTVTHPAPDLEVYKLTPRGRDVSKGMSVVPGVKRPEPGLDDF
ncbi:MAG: ArsR family transcriptional regulator [Deltaproteobacteria bacterium]|nr:ArsR family transcriptional regulator [Deltaproteobacteria bacterium]